MIFLNKHIHHFVGSFIVNTHILFLSIVICYITPGLVVLEKDIRERENQKGIGYLLNLLRQRLAFGLRLPFFFPLENAVGFTFGIKLTFCKMIFQGWNHFR